MDLARENCCSCEETFVKSEKGYHRYNIKNLLSQRDAEALLGVSIPGWDTNDAFVCYGCKSTITTQTVFRGKGKKRKLDVAFLGESTDEEPATYKVSPTEIAIGYPRSYRYKNAFRTLVTNSTAAKRDFMEVFCELLKNEVCIQILFLMKYMEYSWLI